MINSPSSEFTAKFSAGMLEYQLSMNCLLLVWLHRAAHDDKQRTEFLMSSLWNIANLLETTGTFDIFIDEVLPQWRERKAIELSEDSN